MSTKPTAGVVSSATGNDQRPTQTADKGERQLQPVNRISDHSSRRREDKLIVGRLLEHGRANYQFRRDEAPSYFIKLLTQRGERLLWGKDLERALTASTTQPKLGEMIGARRVAREAVTITARQRDAEGRIVSQSEQLAHRNRWVVEKVQFFTERAKLARRVRDTQADARSAVKDRPELMSTYLTLRGAQELAERRINNPEDRERFVALVREAMAGSIKRGEPLPTVRMRTQRRTTTTNVTPRRTVRRDDGPTRE
jgi:hypothetical protein